MAFGARLEDGKWRLCLRKGRTITSMSFSEGPPVEIQFKSQVKAKACADALNEQYWKSFEKTERKGGLLPCHEGMVNLIKDHII
ncbi:MAG: hypothetical protein EOQ39_18955 [Mesorhizobium sp.]|uniref:hypothetical protein n=1 Tax=Mesorhizobium sp. TaxID=1871066 RepID=UPI000FE7EC4E|nr:hypothetical protein [Mesorhizobium sp.]RWB08748.1 MAG: hypothetical protein EOQ37_04380 [Mesorhizobium sp.]RWB13600.1 MAG: hypothetical protein EOQ39_18955 [Mesorhizobium sp.]